MIYYEVPNTNKQIKDNTQITRTEHEFYESFEFCDFHKQNKEGNRATRHSKQGRGEEIAIIGL